MKILRNIQVPTGNILIVQGDRGKLELISVGDYGKDKNVKADFLSLTRDIEGVPNGDILPLTEKWVITLSTQYGCMMNCKFCDAPKVGRTFNASYNDLQSQILTALSIHPEIKHTKRLNIHFARMGEPTFNEDVLGIARNLPDIIAPHLGDSLIHPVLSTMLPKRNKLLIDYLSQWTYIKNTLYNGNAGLQLSINSTSDEQRDNMFRGHSLSLAEIGKIGELLPKPIGRKYALNFALADGYEVDAGKLAGLFDASKFMVKITPLHKTNACEENNIRTTGGYECFTPYRQAEQSLKEKGFDVLVFVPSYDEDLGRITCGNAILSGTEPECTYTELV